MESVVEQSFIFLYLLCSWYLKENVRTELKKKEKIQQTVFKISNILKGNCGTDNLTFTNILNMIVEQSFKSQITYSVL